MNQEIEPKKTALVVDDELLIVEVTAAMLESLGYGVLSATNADEALQIVNTRQQANLPMLDLLITDNRMPHLGDGVRLLKECPARVKILQSGTIDLDLTIDDRALFEREGWETLKKPATLSDIRNTLQRLEDRLRKID